MQKSLLFLGLSLYFTLTLFAQQAVQIEYGISKGTQQKAGSLSLSWYRNDALNSGHVIRVNYDKSLSDNVQKVKSKSLQFDVAKRWHSSLNKKMKLYLEGGISGMVIRSQNQIDLANTFGFEGENDCVFCLTAVYNVYYPSKYLFTEENSHMLYDRKGKSFALNIMPGATTGGGVDVDLTKSFYMGLHYRVNTYYWSGENELLFYVRYGLNAGFLF